MNYPNQPSNAVKRFGVFFLVLFFGLGFIITGILNSRLTREQQTTKSSAQGLSPIQEATCTSRGGECQTGKADQVGRPCSLTDGTPGIVYFNLCSSQPDDIRCCVPNNPTAVPQDTSAYQASMSVKLQGIGTNSPPVNQTRALTLKIFKDDGSFDAADFVAQDVITFDQVSGNFINNSFNFGTLPAGNYLVVAQLEKYLDKQITDAAGNPSFNLSGGAMVQAAPFELRAGDIAPGIRGDNSVNIIDYNAIIGCLPGSPPSACLNRSYADLNDDGIVDQIDLEILMSNFGHNGFAFQNEQFKCEPDPACGGGKDALQLCSLLCTRVSKRS